MRQPRESTHMSQIQGDAPPAGRLTAPPLPRLAAVLVDGTTYLIIPALLVPIGLLLSRRGVTLSSLAVNAIVGGVVGSPAAGADAG